MIIVTTYHPVKIPENRGFITIPRILYLYHKGLIDKRNKFISCKSLVSESTYLRHSWLVATPIAGFYYTNTVPNQAGNSMILFCTIFSISVFALSSVTWVYRSMVIFHVACPRYSCTTFGSTPASKSRVAKVCLNRCPLKFWN